MTQTPEQIRAKKHEYYLRNRDKILAQHRVYRQQVLDPEKQRAYMAAYYAANRDKLLAYTLRTDHGLRPDQWAALWDAQDGRCYLCGEPMIQGGASGACIDHDHSCCPEKRSCPVCRRGLACAGCNTSIGLAQDDPARLRRMADALEAANLLVNERKAEAGEQLTLI
jgi:hypothetical protein